MERPSHLSKSEHRCRLASCGLSAVLEMAFQSQAEGRPKACEQRDSSLDFSNRCRKPDLGSAPHSWRVAQARLRLVGTNSFPLAAASLETSRSRPALADFPEEPSRGDCRDGLLYRPPLTFGVLYCFFIIGHDRRRILHHNVTRNPTALWVTLQLHEAWECGDQPEQFLIFDRDSKFGADVVSTVKAMGSQPIRTGFRSPWQNGVAERWVGSVRRDLLDHVIVLNRKHLRRLLNEYVRYYHEDRTHLGLGKDTPGGRVAASAPSSGHNVISLPRLGGLHHRYTVAS
jgi:transposase InsO family protein